MMHHDWQVRREARRLLLPVADHRHGADDERRATALLLPVALDEGEGLRGLAEPHIVGEARAQPPPPEEAEPRVAAHLVGAERSREAFGYRHLRVALALFQLREQVANPALRFDAGEGYASRYGRTPAQSHLHEVAHARAARRALLPEVERRLNLLGVEFDPLAAHADERGFEPREHLQLCEREALVTERDLPVKLDDLFEREASAALKLRALDDGARCELQLRALARPPGGQHYAKAGLLQQPRLFLQELVRARRVQFKAARRGGFEAALNLRADLRRLPQRREHVLARLERTTLEERGLPPSGVPDLRGRDEQARVVHGLQQVTDLPPALR